MAVEPSGAKGVAMMVNVPWVLNIPMNMGEGASSKTRVYNVYTFLSKHVGEYDDKPRDSRFSDQCIVWTWVVVSKCVGKHTIPRFIRIHWYNHERRNSIWGWPYHIHGTNGGWDNQIPSKHFLSAGLEGQGFMIKNVHSFVSRERSTTQT